MQLFDVFCFQFYSLASCLSQGKFHVCLKIIDFCIYQVKYSKIKLSIKVYFIVIVKYLTDFLMLLFTYLSIYEREILNYFIQIYYSQLGFPGGSVVKNLPANAGASRDMGSTPGSGRSPGGENGNQPTPVFLPEYSKNDMDRRAHQTTVYRITKSQT